MLSHNRKRNRRRKVETFRPEVRLTLQAIEMYVKQGYRLEPLLRKYGYIN